MPKKKRRRKARPAPQPHRVRAAAPPPGEPPLLAEVRGMLQEAHPGALLEFASSVLAAVDPRGHGPLARADDHAPESPTLAELAGTFITVPCRETTALLTVLAEMADDELVVQRLRRELTRRDDRLPVWLERLAPVTVERAAVMRHVLGDGDNVMLTVRTGAGHDLTVIVYIDHNLGTVVKDGFVIHEPIDAVLGSFRSAMDPDPDTVFAELDLADARARATEAIEIGAISFPPFETDTWPVARPLVEWVVRQLPRAGPATSDRSGARRTAAP